MTATSSSTTLLIGDKWYVRKPQIPDRRAVAAEWLTGNACALIRHARGCHLLNTYGYRDHWLGRHWHRFMMWVSRASSEWTEWEPL